MLPVASFAERRCMEVNDKPCVRSGKDSPLFFRFQLFSSLKVGVIHKEKDLGFLVFPPCYGEKTGLD